MAQEHLSGDGPLSALVNTGQGQLVGFSLMWLVAIRRGRGIAGQGRMKGININTCQDISAIFDIVSGLRLGYAAIPHC